MKKIIQTALLAATLSLSPFVFADTTPSFTPSQVTALQKIIHDYIVQNPSVLVEASKTLQAQQEKKMESAAMDAIAQNKAKIFDDANTPSVGNKNAAVTVVEFFDYQCGHCRQMASTIENLISGNKNVRVVFKELPIFGGTSNYAAKAALSVSNNQPNKYFAFHNALLTASSPLNPDSIAAIAKTAGVDVDKMKKGMDAPAVEQQLKANFELAQALKVMGTPTFVIGNKAETNFRYIPGATSLEDLNKQIDAVK